MISLKKWRIFPRSLRQLVIMAFWMVLLPLLVLAYQAYQSLDQLSNQAAITNKNALADTERSEVMRNLAIEMEGNYRRCCVLRDKTDEEMYQQRYQQYSKMFSTLQQTIIPLSESKEAQALNTSLKTLKSIQCKNSEPTSQMQQALEQFSYANNRIVVLTKEIIFSRGEQLQMAIAEKGRYFGWQSLIVFVFSLILIALFTRMIIGPVKGIEKMINRLGEGRTLNNNLNSFQGPRELRSLAQRIIWLSERLAWLESQRHEFLRHISHELKTPLASMREGTELLADEVAGPLTLDQKEVVAILDNSSKQLQLLIEQLLDYNRKLSEVPQQIEEVDLTTLVNDVVLAHSLPARAKGIKTIISLDLKKCRAETTLLSRVIDNLYSNAVYYGAESGNIWISSYQIEQKIVIDIANKGTPIPESEQKMIFEPFFQGSLLRKGAVKGSGLGLSIAHDCIKRMDGELNIVHSDYADVCFRIELPLLSENK
ncbi:two-component sensor histidine kinase [Proteus mirabilis]|uniref:sensor histidine kinase n=1 Tax=Proteus mirabilis TaxID=584 RepID=UPI0009ACA9ED|nr:HAMP domain-containing sensor histidine kinase [Proteus mirabilis]ARA23155.1 two-component sensor histidine kinase [Proteus mirabilis]